MVHTSKFPTSNESLSFHHHSGQIMSWNYKRSKHLIRVLWTGRVYMTLACSRHPALTDEGKDGDQNSGYPAKYHWYYTENISFFIVRICSTYLCAYWSSMRNDFWDSIISKNGISVRSFQGLSSTWYWDRPPRIPDLIFERTKQSRWIFHKWYPRKILQYGRLRKSLQSCE